MSGCRARRRETRRIFPAAATASPPWRAIVQAWKTSARGTREGEALRGRQRAQRRSQRRDLIDIVEEMEEVAAAGTGIGTRRRMAQVVAQLPGALQLSAASPSPSICCACARKNRRAQLDESWRMAAVRFSRSRSKRARPSSAWRIAAAYSPR